MSKNLWLITAKTKIHVGNENTSSYGLIDLSVQRDCLTNLPCINSSSLKGALNEFACSKIEDADKRIAIFGSDKKTKKESQKGGYTFFDANILALPVADDNNNNLYTLKTSEEVIDDCINKAKLFGIEIEEDDLKKAIGYIIEESHAKFKDLCSDDNLPIIARNKLENGESNNLWYEQVLPAETIFFTIIDNNNNEELTSLLEKDTNLVQIGANATIGYGYCQFKKIK